MARNGKRSPAESIQLACERYPEAVQKIVLAVKQRVDRLPSLTVEEREGLLALRILTVRISGARGAFELSSWAPDFLQKLSVVALEEAVQKKRRDGFLQRALSDGEEDAPESEGIPPVLEPACCGC